MIIAIIAVGFSFLLDGFISNYLSFSLVDVSYFTTIYSLISLVVITPYFDNDRKYYLLIIILGLLFDLVYTSTFLINVIIFLVVCIIAKYINFFLTHNLLNVNIISLISIIVYHVLSFVILLIVNYNDYSLTLLFDIITHSIVMTIVYTTILYCVLKKVFDVFNIKEIK